jgi:hypothetical protein
MKPESSLPYSSLLLNISHTLALYSERLLSPWFITQAGGPPHVDWLWLFIHCIHSYLLHLEAICPIQNWRMPHVADAESFHFFILIRHLYACSHIVHSYHLEANIWNCANLPIACTDVFVIQNVHPFASVIVTLANWYSHNTCSNCLSGLPSACRNS